MATLDHTGERNRTAGLKLGWLIAGRLATALLLGDRRHDLDRSGRIATVIHQKHRSRYDRRLPHDSLFTDLSSLEEHTLTSALPTCC